MKNSLRIFALMAAAAVMLLARPAFADEALSLAPDSAPSVSATGPVSTVLAVTDLGVGNDEAGVASYMLGSQTAEQEDD